jgi:hypothetical protein
MIVWLIGNKKEIKQACQAGNLTSNTHGKIK